MKAIAYLLSNVNDIFNTADQNEKLALNKPIPQPLLVEHEILLKVKHITFAYLAEGGLKINVWIKGASLTLKNEPHVWEQIEKHLNKKSK